MRLPVEGTIARGHLTQDQHFALGYLTNDGTSAGTVTEFVKSLPPQLADHRESLQARGRDRFSIYCATCHGPLGAGDGPVSQRAIELKETKWVPATNLLTQMVRDRADGQLFQAPTACATCQVMVRKYDRATGGPLWRMSGSYNESNQLHLSQPCQKNKPRDG
jgi:hypothetical protein